MAKVFKSESFTNQLGQTVNVGDQIAYVTTGWSNAYVNHGVYAGYWENAIGNNYTPSKRVVVMKYSPRTKYRHNETGIEVDYWWNDKRVKEIPYPQYKDYYDHADYNNNREKYLAGIERYKLAVEEYNTARERIQDDYTMFKIPNWGRTTLQLNRIIKIEPILSDEALSILTLPKF